MRDTAKRVRAEDDSAEGGTTMRIKIRLVAAKKKETEGGKGETSVTEKA
jgi:hypothetical protein